MEMGSGLPLTLARYGNGVRSAFDPCSLSLLGWEDRGRKAEEESRGKKRVESLRVGRIFWTRKLNASTCPKDMGLPGLNLHELSGNRKSIWSVKVSGNWRVTFTFVGEHAELVDYEDYH